MDLNKVINKRQSIRSFKSKKPRISEILDAIEAGTKAPLAGNLPAIKYILVQNKETIEKLAIAAQQSFINQVDYVIVVCSDKTLLEKYYYDRAEKYSKEQAGAAIQNILLKITDQELGSCWIGAFSEISIRNALKIPENIEVIAILPVGIPSDQEPMNHQTKPQLERILFYEQFGNREMKPLKCPEVQG